jgi:hypothetical protein
MYEGKLSFSKFQSTTIQKEKVKVQPPILSKQQRVEFPPILPSSFIYRKIQ